MATTSIAVIKASPLCLAGMAGGRSAIDQKKAREFTAPGKRQFYFHAAWKDFTDSFGRPLIQPHAGRCKKTHAKFLHVCEQWELLWRAFRSLIEHRPRQALQGAVDQAVGDTLHIAAHAGIER